MTQSRLAVITALFSLTPVRQALLVRALGLWRNQECSCSFYLIHLLMPDEQALDLSQFPSDMDIHYINIVANEMNCDLWQKEALYNIAAKNVSEDHVLFLDGDITCQDPLWFSSIVNCLECNPNQALQPFRSVEDEEYSALNFCSSVAALYEINLPYPAHGAGTAWAFNLRFFNSIGGFNPLYLDGSGDTAFLYQWQHYEELRSAYLLRFQHFVSLLRPGCEQGDLSYLPFALTHLHHGKSRSYGDRWNLLQLVKKPFSDYYHLTAEGLLEWRKDRPDNLLRDINKLILTRLNSKQVHLSKEFFDSYMEKDKLTLPTEVCLSIDDRLSIVGVGANWPLLTPFAGHAKRCQIDFYRPISSGQSWQLVFRSIKDLALQCELDALTEWPVHIDQEILDEQYRVLSSQSLIFSTAPSINLYQAQINSANQLVRFTFRGTGTKVVSLSWQIT